MGITVALGLQAPRMRRNIGSLESVTCLWKGHSAGVKRDSDCWRRVMSDMEGASRKGTRTRSWSIAADRVFTQVQPGLREWRRMQTIWTLSVEQQPADARCSDCIRYMSCITQATTEMRRQRQLLGWQQCLQPSSL